MSNGPAIVAGAAVLALGAAKAAQTVMGRAEWSQAVQMAAARTLPNLTPAARELLVAHAAFESGFGNATAARVGHNIFNVTAGSSWAGPTYTDVGGDTEYTADGVKRITQVWRVYGSLDEAVADYWRLLSWTRYRPARTALEQGNLSSFTAALYAGGYFTLPVALYTARLGAVQLEVKGYLS